MRKDTIETELAKNWPIDSLIVECHDCSNVLLNTNEERLTMWSPKHLVRVIAFRAEKHNNLGGHSSLEININPEPKVVDEIDCKITVNK